MFALVSVNLFCKHLISQLKYILFLNGMIGVNFTPLRVRVRSTAAPCLRSLYLTFNQSFRFLLRNAACRTETKLENKKNKNRKELISRLISRSATTATCQLPVESDRKCAWRLMAEEVKFYCLNNRNGQSWVQKVTNSWL